MHQFISSYNKVMPDDGVTERALLDALLDSLFFRCAPYTIALLNPSKWVRTICIIWMKKGEGSISEGFHKTISQELVEK